MKLGIGSFTYPWAVGVPGHPPAAPLTALALCQRALDFGIHVVQFADNLPLHRLPESAREEVLSFARHHHLELEIGTRGVHAGQLTDCLALAQRVGTRFVRLVIDSPGYEPDPDTVLRDLRPHVERFRSAGLRLGLENHDRFSAETLVRLVETLGPDATGIVLDTVNSFGALEGPEAVLPRLAPYTLNLHLKDFTVRRIPSQMGFVVEGCPAGQGRLDIPRLLQRLTPASAHVPSFPLNAILELWTPRQASVEETVALEQTWAQESLHHLRTLLHD
ncbi:MAG: sugar phosphate isomerase/epimerase [Verrucomicrobiales bacterium]|nr:sugar phosphate isomerase/epimerase [Verrucomicrobiales bacterium]